MKDRFTWVVSVAAVLVMLLAAGPGVRAQATPQAEPVPLVDILPTQQDLGLSWVQAATGDQDLEGGVFTDGIAANYVGPYGARLFVMLWRHETDRGSVLRAWEEAANWFDSARYGAIDLDLDFERESELEERPLPAGVADAVRIDGEDNWSWQQVGLGLYAIEPDLIALVLIEGSTEVAPRTTGAAAADLIAEIIVSRMAS